MPSAGAVVSLLVLGMSGWALYSAAGWPWKAALFPLVVGIPVLLLAAVELYSAVCRRKEAPQTADSMAVRRRTLGIFGWIGAFFLLVIGIGFLAAIPAFIVAYLRLAAHERWPITLVLAGAAWAVIYGFFVKVVHIPLAEGLVQGWLRALGVPI